VDKVKSSTLGIDIILDCFRLISIFALLILVDKPRQFAPFKVYQ